MAKLDAHLLTTMAPHNSGERGARQSAIIAGVGAILADTLAAYNMSSPLRAAHFLAQICHESDGFVTTVEYAGGKAYENRVDDLGNTQPGDGPRFKGRGLIQLTGRTNYRKYGDLLGLDLINNPELAADPATSLKLACEYWKQHVLNAFADKDDIETITRRINGGLNGLKSRQAYLACAKAALGEAAAKPATAPHPVLRRGDQGEAVKALQQRLTKMGYAAGCDGMFGPGTEGAVMQFQTAQGMVADGVVGAQTWARLGA
jgi:putative chitinase